MRNKEKITFGIIGYGRFGKLWAKYMSRHGQVFVFDKKNKIIGRSSKIIGVDLKRAASADIVFLAVPISEIENCSRSISALLPARTLVADVCSVKMFPAAAMKKFLPKNQPILATHPLFGPDSEKINHGLQGLKIVVCRVAGKSALERRLIGIFKKLKLKIIFTTPEKHDRQMATSQALVHFIGRGLAKLKLDPQEISTPDYNSLVRMHQMVNNDTLELFFDMQTKNKFAAGTRERFLRGLEKLHEAAKTKNTTMAGLRKDIESVDASLIALLALRLKIIKKIGMLKQRNKLRIVDRHRENDLISLHRKYSKQNNIDTAFTDKLFNLIINHSRAVQRKRQ